MPAKLILLLRRYAPAVLAWYRARQRKNQGR